MSGITGEFLFMTENDRFGESDDDMARTRRLMGALGRLPPKQHKNMKLGKLKGKAVKAHKHGHGDGAKQ
jgi:hypothetical protein